MMVLRCGKEKIFLDPLRVPGLGLKFKLTKTDSHEENMHIYFISILHDTGAFLKKARPEEAGLQVLMLGLMISEQSCSNLTG